MKKRARTLFAFFAVFFLLAFSKISFAEYTAYSLKVAKDKIISVSDGKDFRKLYPEVFTLAGITVIKGLVWDSNTQDIILVGERNSDKPALTLDDFVVALRAKFIHSKWPLVSIDPIFDTEKINMQTVRYEGGIEETQFGKDLFDADYLLKQIEFEFCSFNIPGLSTHFDLSIEEAKRNRDVSKKEIESRFWFYPTIPSVTIRKDVVSIEGLKIGLFTEVLSAEVNGEKIKDISAFHDTVGDLYAQQITDNFDRLAEVYSPISKLQGLCELVALTKAIEEMDTKLELSFWLRDYQVKRVNTTKETRLLKRSERYVLHTTDGIMKLSGGVQLMAVALMLKAGDITALKKAVLITRSSFDSLSWNFIAGEWLIPSSPGMLAMKDIAFLFEQETFLANQKKYDDAIALCTKIIELNSNITQAYLRRALNYFDKEKYELAISDLNKVCNLNPNHFDAYTLRGSSYALLGKSDYAMRDFNKAIEINPYDGGSYDALGLIYKLNGDCDKALIEFNRAIELGYDKAYIGRSAILMLKGDYKAGFKDNQIVINKYPNNTSGWADRAFYLAGKGKYKKAMKDIERALMIDPKDPDVWFAKGAIHAVFNQREEAIYSFNRFLILAPPAYKKSPMMTNFYNLFDRIKQTESKVQNGAPNKINILVVVMIILLVFLAYLYFRTFK